jgi:[acyl-carrier-protein] S-malonyltransferase
MTKTAVMFPGQGGQFVGMGAAWADGDPDVAALFKLADEVTSLPVSKLCREGPLDELSRTKNLQPAALLVGLAAFRLARKSGAEPLFAAGHSLGEFGALVAAGSLSEAEALALVAKRAAIMEEAAKSRPGAMTAILGLDAATIEAVCELARDQGYVAPANYNSPLQTVISGEPKAVAAATRFAEMKGGKAVTLPVSGAFHGPLMEEANRLFAAELDKVDFKNPKIPVVPNALGKPIQDLEELKKLIRAQMTSPVLFRLTIESLAAAGVDEYVECWPKPYLGPMIRKSLPSGAEKASIRPAAK